MATPHNLTPGQSIAQRFTLKRRLAGSGACEQWLADDEVRSQAARLSFFPEHKTTELGDEVTTSCRRAMAVVHPGLVPLLGLFEHGGAAVLAHHFVDQVAEPLVDGDYRAALGRCLPLIDTLAYLHDLGLVHGAVETSQLRAGSDKSLMLDGLGMAWIASNALPDRSTEVGAVAKLLQKVSGANDGTPLPSEISELLAAMQPGQQNVRDLHEVYRRLARALGVAGSEDGPKIVASPEAGSIQVIERGTAGPSRSNAAVQARRSVPMLLAVPALVLMILAAVYVLFFLPRPEVPVVAIDDSPATSAVQPSKPVVGGAASAPAGQGNAPFAQAAAARERQAAQDAAMNLLRSLVALEERAVSDWAPEDFARARQAGDDGDALYREQAYAEALARYEQGIGLAKSLVVRSGEILADALAQGDAALAAGDGEAARIHFEQALAIDEEHPAAKQGLERVAKLADVLARMDRGAELEQSGDLVAARAEYSAAGDLDPQFAPAGEALERIGGRLGARRFQDLMSRGFKALDAGDTEVARSAFQQAASLRPNAAGPRDALAQVATRARTRDIATRRSDAQAAEAREDWQSASALYGSILQTDDTLVFARQGKARADTRARLAGKMQRYIDEPLRMSDNPAYNDARAALAAARQVANPGPRLAQQISELAGLVAVARDPVTVQLRSDGLTRVVILKLGEVGTFQQQAVGLVPGRYTAVGSRTGYRDVRREFEVRAGQSPGPISIICEEPV